MAKKYRDSSRRILIDKHIGDWDDRFLAKYNSENIAQNIVKSQANGAMIYFQSHLGLCYWPTISGVQHKACMGRDFAGETLKAIKNKNIPTCAYYSIGFNNEEYLKHENWRIKPASKPTIGILPRERYGICCINNLEYQDFIDAQIEEILQYDIDAIFFDMVWWNGICLCDACQKDYGKKIPKYVDWQSEEWLSFQTHREKKLADFTQRLRTKTQEIKPQLEVYHNFALALSNYTRGMSFEAIKGHDFLGGDFYGDKFEQLIISLLMLNISPKRPQEFMTTVSANLTEHNFLRTDAELQFKINASLLSDAAFLGIIAINPDGTIDDEAIKRLGDGFEKSKKFEKYLGGTHVEDIGIYYSDASRKNIENATCEIINAPSSSASDYSHFRAISGAAKALANTHANFGIFAKPNLKQLQNFQTICLCDVQIMDEEEIAAFKNYVQNGGNLYLSRNSLRHFCDIFEAQILFSETGKMIYLQSDILQSLKRPLSHHCDDFSKSGALRIKIKNSQKLANLVLPYAYPNGGNVKDKDFASIHSWPAFEEVDFPTIISKKYGKGNIIYCAADIETNNAKEAQNCFLELINRFEISSDIEINAHEAIWTSCFLNIEKNTLSIRLLNSLNFEENIPINGIKVKIKNNKKIQKIWSAQSECEINFIEKNGFIEFAAPEIKDFDIIIIEFENA